MRYLVLLILGLGLTAKAGQDGGGGDVIFCTDRGYAFNRSGYYMLDYVILSSNKQWVQKSSQLEYLQEMRNRIKFLSDFNSSIEIYYIDHFIKKYEEKLLGKEVAWIPTELDLVDIEDENLPDNFIFPSNCSLESLRQAVTKVSDNRYFYDAWIEDELLAHKDLLQTNIRNLHEMLRSILDDADQIRKWIRILNESNFYEKFADVEYAFDRMFSSGLKFNWQEVAKKHYLEKQGYFYPIMKSEYIKKSQHNFLEIEEAIGLISDKFKYIIDYNLSDKDKNTLQNLYDDLDERHEYILAYGSTIIGASHMIHMNDYLTSKKSKLADINSPLGFPCNRYDRWDYIVSPVNFLTCLIEKFDDEPRKKILKLQNDIDILLSGSETN